MTTATNPGLQAYVEAYGGLKTACEQMARILMNHAVGKKPLTAQQMMTFGKLLRQEINMAECILDDYVTDALADNGTLERIIEKHLGVAKRDAAAAPPDGTKKGASSWKRS